MKVDNNPNEHKAFRLLALGHVEERRELEDAFLKEALESKAYCSCPETGCRWHGNCKCCVLLHRGAGDHIPFCFHDMLNSK